LTDLHVSSDVVVAYPFLVRFLEKKKCRSRRRGGKKNWGRAGKKNENGPVVERQNVT
jgi:hypothetical protein